MVRSGWLFAGAATATVALLFLKRDQSATPAPLPFEPELDPLPKTPRPTTNEAHLKQLRTPVAALARQLLASSPVPIVIVQSFRSAAEQARLYAQGRTAPGPIVTHAKPGTSYHEFGLAFDVAVLKDGKPTWPNDVALWTSIGEQ